MGFCSSGAPPAEVFNVHMQPDFTDTGAFKGDIYASADWTLRMSFIGQRVAVIGMDEHVLESLPCIARTADAVKFFQLEPRWILPRIEQPVLAGLARRVLPVERLARGAGARLAARAGRAYMTRQVGDGWMRWQLTPKPGARPGAPLFSNDFHGTLQRSNCKLVTWPIARITPGGIRTADGLEHQVDVIFLAHEAMSAPLN